MPDPLRDLSIQLEWNAETNAHAYAVTLADANNVSMTRLLGKYFAPAEWRRVTRSLAERLSIVSGQPESRILLASAYNRYPPTVVEDPILGFLDRTSADGRILLDVLPAQDPRTHLIQRQARTQSGPHDDHRLPLLEQLGTSLLRRLTDQWPPGLMAEDEERREWVVRDPTRHLPANQWSRRVREYVTLTTWEHAGLGYDIEPIHRDEAEDILLIDELMSLTRDSSSIPPELTHAVGLLGQDLRAHPNPPEDWYSGPWLSEPTGPFSLPRLAQWPEGIVDVVHAADEVATTLYQDEHDPSWMTTPMGVQWYEDTRLTLKRLERLIFHVSRRPAARALFDAVATLAENEPPPFTASQLRRQRLPINILAIQYAHKAMPISSKTLTHLLWIDLCGHLPLEPARRPGVLPHACRSIDTAAFIEIREQAVDLLAGNISEAELALPPLPRRQALA